MTSIDDVLAYIIGIVALIVSVLAYIQSRPSAQLRRDQKASMHNLASEALITSDLLPTVIYIANQPDIYLLGVMQNQAKCLREAMRDAIRLGLWNEVVGVRPHSLPMYTAFVGNLISAGEPEAGPDTWLKEHFTMGIVRVILLCNEYHKSLKGPIGPLLTGKVLNYGNLGEQCWTYLSQNGQNAQNV